jgi:hypothetical protein
LREVVREEVLFLDYRLDGEGSCTCQGMRLENAESEVEIINRERGIYLVGVTMLPVSVAVSDPVSNPLVYKYSPNGRVTVKRR